MKRNIIALLDQILFKKIEKVFINKLPILIYTQMNSIEYYVNKDLLNEVEAGRVKMNSIELYVLKMEIKDYEDKIEKMKQESDAKKKIEIVI